MLQSSQKLEVATGRRRVPPVAIDRSEKYGKLRDGGLDGEGSLLVGGHQFLPLELSIGLGLGLYRREAVLLLPDVDQWMQELDVTTNKHGIGFAKLEVNGGILTRV